jgi:DNA helicase-2/ATP-dependent DNA helicase PcrA
MQWSQYQEEIFRAVERGDHNIIINAVAGSGKTTTLVEAARRWVEANPGRDIMFSAFNTKIRDELSSRVSFPVLTINQIGHRLLLRDLGGNHNSFNERIAWYTTLDYIDANLKPRGDSQKYSWAHKISTAVSKCMVTLTDPENTESFDEMLYLYDIDFSKHPDILRQGTVDCLALLERVAKEKKRWNFDGQIYLPWKFGLMPPRVDMMLVDECQDLSGSKLDLVLKTVRDGGRLIACGDPNQAIYLFAGAGASSFSDIKERADCVEYPLSVNFRCPTKIIDFVKPIVPQIIAHDGATDGVLEVVRENEIYDMLKDGDMILCRRTAPLITMCFQMIGRGVPAKVLGRDIGESIIKDVIEISKLPGFDFHRFMYFFELWEEMNINRIEGRPESPRVQAKLAAFQDRADGVESCFTGMGVKCENIEVFKQKIAALFSEDRSPITLSVVHRVKGLENDRIFILRPDQLPMFWQKQKPEEFEQELNLKYVAYTRAKKECYIVVENDAPRSQASPEAFITGRFDLGFDSSLLHGDDEHDLLEDGDDDDYIDGVEVEDTLLIGPGEEEEEWQVIQHEEEFTAVVVTEEVLPVEEVKPIEEVAPVTQERKLTALERLKALRKNK